MATSREKINKILDFITDKFGLKELDLVVKKVDVKAEIGKKISELDDAKLDELVGEIKKVVNEE